MGHLAPEKQLSSEILLPTSSPDAQWSYPHLKLQALLLLEKHELVEKSNATTSTEILANAGRNCDRHETEKNLNRPGVIKFAMEFQWF